MEAQKDIQDSLTTWQNAQWNLRKTFGDGWATINQHFGTWWWLIMDNKNKLIDADNWNLLNDGDTEEDEWSLAAFSVLQECSREK